MVITKCQYKWAAHFSLLPRWTWSI